jgi:hypothetical protein
MYLLLFKEHVVQESRGKLTLMGIENPLTFGDHAVDQNSKAITFIIYG